MIDIYTTSRLLRSVRLFSRALFGKVFHPNLFSFVIRRHVGAHPDGHQHGGSKVTETSVIEFCRRNEKLLL